MNKQRQMVALGAVVVAVFAATLLYRGFKPEEEGKGPVVVRETADAPVEPRLSTQSDPAAEPAEPVLDSTDNERAVPEHRRKNDDLIQKSILAVGVNHPYTKLPEATLQSLSYSDAVAAVVLARKTEDNEKARELYERAVALKWRPSPLIEWMTHRNIGGLSWTDGKLDVRAAKIGYKVQLVVQAIAGYDEPMLADYKQALEENDVDTAEIEAEAATYLRELEEQHLALTGGPRP